MSQLYENKNELGASSSSDDLPPLPWEDRTSLYETEEFSKIERMEAEIAEWRARAAIQAAAPAEAPTINPMCERKTNHIIERDGYAKSGYVLRKEGADICVSDGGAVAWFTPEQWNWLMFNRMHTTFDWPKPIGWRAPAEDAREQQPDGEPSVAGLAAVLREIILSAKAARAWLIADRARNALHMLAAIESCRATGTDRAQAGEAPAGAEEEGK